MALAVTIVLWLCAAVSVAVFAVMLYSIATFPRSPAGTAATFRHSRLSETLWAMIPIGILIGTAVPAIKMLLALMR
jgi:cytochrome c oxidase subunit II